MGVRLPELALVAGADREGVELLTFRVTDGLSAEADLRVVEAVEVIPIQLGSRERDVGEVALRVAILIVGRAGAGRNLRVDHADVFDAIPVGPADGRVLLEVLVEVGRLLSGLPRELKVGETEDAGLVAVLFETEGAVDVAVEDGGRRRDAGRVAGAVREGDVTEVRVVGRKFRGGRVYLGDEAVLVLEHRARDDRVPRVRAPNPVVERERELILRLGEVIVDGVERRTGDAERELGRTESEELLGETEGSGQNDRDKVQKGFHGGA